ncbi:hypothetical protein GOP47_0004200 [Adiantum capillus-veneris]|uniref:glucan endo-1,3-beta-D-glucosidase n=1 Tax=Adiantum capillus-veneris TaxID=13818 RepID=A0A9D4V7P6_ADICA|nr:hypothetical protein GOP47_0004200 [Adiantum capillus-veneris]
MAACAHLFLLLALGFPLQETLVGVSALGFNWGTITSHPVPPRVVVQMLKANNISKVKLFDANPAALSALAGSGIEVMVGIPNELLHTLASSSAAADAWVSTNLTSFMGKRGANIRYVAVGNEPFLSAYGVQFQNSTYPAMKNIYESLAKVGLGDQVKVTVPCNADVLLNTPPSKGQFRSDVKETMRQIAALLSQINAPLLVNIYPFLDLTLQTDFPEDFAFFDGTTHALVDGAVTYTNALDASLDMIIVALAGVGYPNVQVFVGEIGWPTDGAIYANVSTAQRFNQGLVKHILSKQGTPQRPGVQIEAYIFGLLDENQKSLLPGNFERHWGVFTFDGQAKYTLDFSGQGLDTNLVNADSVPYLPSRWCVANPKSNESDLVRGAQYACANADCTALAYGGSCSNVGMPDNASYAFNSYYQLNQQDDNTCSFNGLGVITFVDPSIGDCRFLIGVSRAVQTISCFSTSKEAVDVPIIGNFHLLPSELTVTR